MDGKLIEKFFIDIQRDPANAMGSHPFNPEKLIPIYLDRVTGERLLWSADFDVPAIGEEINVRMNGIGRATVKGYFSSDGYLGVMMYPLNPPKWLVKQQAAERKTERWAKRPEWSKRGIGCVFGIEMERIAQNANNS